MNDSITTTIAGGNRAEIGTDPQPTIDPRVGQMLPPMGRQCRMIPTASGNDVRDIADAITRG